MATLKTFDIEVDDETISVAWTKTLALGESYGLTAYDAAYLELTLRKGLPLVSLDGPLRSACSQAWILIRQKMTSSYSPQPSNGQ